MRKRRLAALAAAVFVISGLFLAISFPIGIIKFPAEDLTVTILLCICIPFISLYLLLVGALNIRNLFFPYVLTSDEKGIYNYSGLFHYGFVSWEDIAEFGKDATLLDFLDNDTPCIRVIVRDLKAYKKTLSFGKKWLLFWGGGTIKIYALCSQIKRKQLFGLLENTLAYYKQPDGATVENEREEKF